jgi:hypothetical protein
MSYTGTEVFNMAIAVIDELSDTGAVNDAQVREYKNRAKYLLDIWQHELKKIENITSLTKITDLTQTLQVSEEGCMSGVYYLALHFALSDQNSELAALCRGRYYELKNSGRTPQPITGITDVYGIAGIR